MSENSCITCGQETRSGDHFCSNCGFQLAHASRKPTRRPINLQRDLTNAGVFTLVLGAIIGLFGFLAGIVPILALGLGGLILGAMTLLIPESMSAKAGRFATFSSLPALLNIEALIVDLDVSSRGIYIPTSGFGIIPKVLVPLNDSVLDTLTPFPKSKLSRSRRFFVTLGTGMFERGILLYSPGEEIVQAVESCLQLDVGTIKFSELADRIGFVFEMLGISRRGLSLELEGSTIQFKMDLMSLVDLEERLRAVTPRLVEQIGSPMTSAVAATVAKVTGKFVRLHDSSVTGSVLTGSLELLENSSI